MHSEGSVDLGREGESILVDYCITLFHVSVFYHHYYMHLLLIYIFISFIFLFIFQGMGRGVTGNSELK